MGKKPEISRRNRSKTLPSSPTHSSSSSSDFEFRISLSPRKSSAALCPADELFYKGQLLPLHLSPRISMVRTLLLASSSSSSSSDATTSASRDSSSSNDSSSSDLSLLAAGDPFCDSSRPSSVTDDDLRPTLHNKKSSLSKFSLSRFSNVFKKDPPKSSTASAHASSTSVKKMSASAKEVIRRYLKKVKPLYEKLSSKQQQQQQQQERRRDTPESTAVLVTAGERSGAVGGGFCQSFSGNLKCPRMIRRSYVASCPSSMRSSPSHSGVLTRTGMATRTGTCSSDTSTMEELQNAIQGAIAHCKNSMLQNSNNCKAFEI